MREQTKKKLEYSINLMQRAEPMALRYDPDNGFCLAFSGGKDSQALYHIAKMAGVKFHAYFAPTSVDPPELIMFIRRNYPDVEFMTLKESIYKAAVSMRHQTMPTRIMRWCCEEFKEVYGAGTVTLIGIRREESVKRSKRNEVEVSSRKFSENFDQFSEHEEKMITCVGGNDKILVSPMLDWTEEDVWDFLNSQGIEHCELYDLGYKRIGCILCPMGNLKQKMRDMRRYPHAIRKWMEVVDTCKNAYWSERKDFQGLTTRELFKYWISGLSIREFREKYISPRLFSEEEIGKDEIDKLIDHAYEAR